MYGAREGQKVRRYDAVIASLPALVLPVGVCASLE